MRHTGAPPRHGGEHGDKHFAANMKPFKDSTVARQTLLTLTQNLVIIRNFTTKTDDVRTTNMTCKAVKH